MDITVQKVKEKIKELGYSYVSGNIDSRSKRFVYKCSSNHQHEVQVGLFLEDRKCPTCANKIRADKRKNNFDIIKEAFKTKGYEVKSDYYKNRKVPLKVICPVGHEWNVTWNNFNAGRTCPECYEWETLPINEALKPFYDENYTIVNGKEEYVNVKSILEVQCNKKHTPYKVRVYNFRNGKRCPGCCARTSKQDTAIFEFVKKFDPNVKASDTTILNGKHIDVYSEKFKIGIEHNGLVWHSSKFNKDKNYHLDKTLLSKSKGVKLFHFFGDEYQNKKTIVEAMINKAFNNNLTSIYARKCSLKEVHPKDYKTFFNNNHLQGSTGCIKCWGLYYNNDLIIALSVRKIRYTKDKNKYEIARLATKIGYHVPGGLSKLLKSAYKFVQSQGSDKLYTFADRRYSDGNAYIKVGFKLLGYTKPGFWYTDGNKRYHRYTLRKTKACPVDMINDDWRKSQGYYKIYDCGQVQLVYSSK